MARETITTSAHGIDVSHWQETYVYAKTFGQVDFAIAKIGEGYNSPYSTNALGDFTDFNKIWIGGCDQVAIRGVYFYQRSGYSWQQQADNVLNAIAQLATKPHMLWLDLEKGNNVIDKTMLADTLRIMDYWRDNSPYTVGLYCNKDVLQYYVETIGLQAYGQEWLNRLYMYPQFYAQYWNVPSPDKDPSLPPKLFHWEIYQYTDKGDSFQYIDGTQWRRYGSPDLDVFNGTVEEMKDWLGITDEPPIDPPPVIIPPTGGTMLLAHNPSPLNLRASPSTGAVLRTMPANTAIEGTEIVTHTDGSKWLKVTSPQAGYCASWLLAYDTAPPPSGLPVLHISADGYQSVDMMPL